MQRRQTEPGKKLSSTSKFGRVSELAWGVGEWITLSAHVAPVASERWGQGVWALMKDSEISSAKVSNSSGRSAIPAKLFW